MTVTLKHVARDDIKPLFAIKIDPSQKDFVAPHEISLAQVPYEEGATPYVIWNDESRVGLMLVIDMRVYPHRSANDDPEAFYLWRLSIGAEFQGNGYGTGAIAEMEKLAREQGLFVIETSTVKSNTAALKFYVQLGFEKTGIEIDGEVQLRKVLQ